MKKKFSFIYAILTALTVTGCSSTTTTTTSPATSGSETAVASASSEAEVALSDTIEGEITVSYYDTVTYKDFLENAAKAFEAKYPGTTVNLETSTQITDTKSSSSDGEQKLVVTAEEDTQGQSDYISKLNTSLMSGGGADVIAMDIIPYYKYAENGQLVDLQSFMDSDDDFNTADYRMNVIEALKYQGGQYVFPLDYTYNYWEYDSSLFDAAGISQLEAADGFTIEELFEIAASQSSEQEVMGLSGYMSPSEGTSVFNEMFMSNYNSYIDIANRIADFTSGGFANLLDTVKGWEDQGKILKSTNESISVDDFTTSTDEQYFYKLKYNLEPLIHYLGSEGLEVSIPVAGVTLSTNDNDTAAGLGKGQDGSYMFSYGQAYGINSNSQNKTLAWEFIKFLASQEMQESLQMYSTGIIPFPIHNEARKNKALDGIVGELFMQTGEPSTDKELTQAQQAALDEYINITEGYSDMLNYCPIEDTTINSIIQAGVKDFFDGQSTSEEAASAIQSKVDMYLNE